MLSSDLQQQMSFFEFEQDTNFTLLTHGCWHVVDPDPASPPTLEKDGVTWETGVEMEYVPSGSTSIEEFYWHFHWRMEQGRLVIVGIGLEATGVEQSTNSPCPA
jgi:hypothetical protein